MTEFTFTHKTEDDDSIETIDHIPQELKERQQWLCYRKEWNADKQKYDKIPKAPRWTIDGDYIKKIGVRSSDEWTTHDEAQAFVEETQERLDEDEALSGVGFVLTEDDPYVFLDLDDHVEGGEISELARDWLDTLNGWSEVSQSGEGLHTFVKAYDFSFDGLKKRDDSIGVEMYSDARFAALTGDTLTEYSQCVPKRVNPLNEVAERYLEKEEDESSMEPMESEWDEGDRATAEEAINTACKYDETFKNLHNGGTEHHDTSHDDISYLTKCFFWAKGDESLVREIARQSSRTRAKWEETRNGKTWFDGRVEEAKNYQDEKFNGTYI